MLLEMYVTVSDFSSKLLGSVIHVSNGDVDNYGVVRSYRNNAVSLYLTDTNNRNRSVSSDYVDGIYNWKKVDAELLSSWQVSYISLVRMLIDKVREKFEVELDINEYSVIFGSHIGSFRYILDRRGLRHEICSCICIPVEPYGYLVLCVKCDTGKVYVCLLEGTEKISDSYEFYDLEKSSYSSSNFILGRRLFLAEDGNELSEIFEDVKAQLQGFVWKGFNFKNTLEILDCEIVPFNRIKISDMVMNVEYFADIVKDSIGDINSEVVVNRWYRSSGGNYYAYLGDSLSNRMFVYLKIENVYSVSGIVLYKELVACCYSNASRYYYSNYHENVIGRFRGKSKRVSLLELAMKTNMITSSRYCPDALSCEICPSLDVTRVLDGANQVDVFLTGTRFCLYKRHTYENVITFVKGDECKYRL